MDGWKLPPFVILKGQRNGRIIAKKLPDLNSQYDDVVFSCQENAWCDEKAMLEWIELVWKPFATLKYPHLTLLILDQFSVHKTNSVLEALSDLGTIVIHLPPGETSKLQILDVGVNRPFKHYCQLGIHEFDTISRAKISQVIQDSWSKITQETINQTYQHIGYEL
jgi:hypothetical protein